VVKHQVVAIQTFSAGRTRQVGINVAPLSSRKWQCIAATEAKPPSPWRVCSWESSNSPKRLLDVFDFPNLVLAS
jgi:hypothetical protein